MKGRTSEKVIAVIPARWASTRFPGKALATISGEPMIAHVVRRARAARSVGEVIVATDDGRIADAAAAAAAVAVMTGPCQSGTDRVAEAALGREGWEVVVNIQGDEPLLAAANVDALVEAMLADPDVGLATLCRPLEEELLDDPNAVKVVRDRRGRALYFSRSAIPYPREREAAAGLWRLHLGIYGYRREALRRFVAWPPSALERAEGLEQLRALENGMSILVVDAPCAGFGVDTPEDLARVERLIQQGAG